MSTLISLLAAIALGAAVTFVIGVFLMRRINDRAVGRLRQAITEVQGRARPEHAVEASGILGLLVRLARALREVPGYSELVSRLETSGRLRQMHEQLEMAGMRSELQPRDLIEAQALGAIIGLAFPPLVAGFTPRNLLMSVVLAAVVFRLVRTPVTNARQERQMRVQSALPKAADIFVVAVEAGMTVDKAMVLYCERFPGPLADELIRIQDDIQVGVRRGDAYKAAMRRVGLDDLSRFLGAILLAERFGVPVAMVLRDQSEELRQLRTQRIREASMKAPVKMLVPTVALIMPSLFIVLLGPVAIKIATGGLF